MALGYDASIEKDFYQFGVYNQITIKTKEKCLICKKINENWDSYILCCDHKAHTRCYRRYLFEENELKCPICGKLDWPEICDKCHQRGHIGDEECPLIRETMNNVENVYIDIKLKGPKDIYFQNKFETLWAWFFEKLKWKWKYVPTSVNNFNFILKFDELDLPVRIVTTERYQDLQDIANGISKEGNNSFLLLGSRLFDEKDIEKASMLESERNKSMYRIIGLISYKIRGRKERFNSMAILIKTKEDLYSLAWIHENCNWIISFDCINKARSFDTICKCASYYDFTDEKLLDQCDTEISKIWKKISKRI